MTADTSESLAPKFPVGTASRSLPLEGLRGLAAAAVFFGHTLVFPVDCRWTPPDELRWFETGQAAVLVFFILSGYVIGITNAVSFTAAHAGNYLRRRAVRLVPINILGVILALLVGSAVSLRDAVGNLVFAENDLGYFGATVHTLDSNPNLWSLNYEVVCYLCFLLVWRRPVHHVSLLAALLTIAASGWWLPHHFQFLTAYSSGLVFWFAGLALAWLVPPAPTSGGACRVPWPAALLLALVTWRMNFLGAIARRFDCDTVRGSWVSFDFLEFLPVGVWLVALATGRENRLTRALPWLAVGWLGANFTWRAARGTWLVSTSDKLYLILFIAAFVLLAWRPPLDWLARIAPFGAISFGFYAFAAPVQRLVATSFPAFSGSGFSYAARVIGCFLLAAALAWLAECRLQPWLKRRLLPRIARTSTGIAPAGA